jgi:hypothetical protein
MIIEIEPHSGFCSGVKRVVKLAETELRDGKKLQCLGEIVHNQAEVERLQQSGMDTLSSNEAGSLDNSDVLIRAHGEPPSTYSRLSQGKNRVIDGTCPVVLRVQKRIREAYQLALQDHGQLFAAGGAFPDAFPRVGLGLLVFQISRQLVGLTDHAAMRAFGAFGPTLRFQEFARLVRVTEMRSNDRSVFHALIMRRFRGFVKYTIPHIRRIMF